MCPKSSQLAAAMSLIFCVDLGCTWDGHGWLWKHIQFAVTPWLLPFPIIWRAKNITSAYFTATIQENEAKWHMSFWTFCFQIKITPRRGCQWCRLILLKRQIKGWGFQKCNQKFFWHTGMRLNCLPKRHFETLRTEEVNLLDLYDNMSTYMFNLAKIPRAGDFHEKCYKNMDNI